VETFERREDELLAVIHEKLKAGIYRFKPARRVMTPKEGSAKRRKLGIPVVMDRAITSKHLWKEGHEWCVSIDLVKFFDEIPHDLILKRIRRKVADERLVTLIARALKAGIVIEGKFEKTPKGYPKDTPRSPMLFNNVLNELDQGWEKKGHLYQDR